MKYAFVFGLIFSSGIASAQFSKNLESLCEMLKDPSLPEYTRKVVQMRCNGGADGTVQAKKIDGQGVVRMMKNGEWKTVATVPGVGDDWTINYDNRIFTFVSPDGMVKKSVSTVESAQ